MGFDLAGSKAGWSGRLVLSLVVEMEAYEVVR